MEIYPKGITHSGSQLPTIRLNFLLFVYHHIQTEESANLWSTTNAGVLSCITLKASNL